MVSKIEYGKDPKKCLICQKPIDYEKRMQQIYCSFNCSVVKRNKELEIKIFEGKVQERKTLRKWIIRNKGYVCEICKSRKWLGKEMPLELDHVNGNAGDNTPSNLRMICPNCHAIQPTSKGKNRGSGRTIRNLPRN